MKTILVTGGAGFIGSHLCARLIERGEKVVCLDNMFTGTYNNIQPLFSNPNFVFINANIIEPISMNIDEIYNLACPASPIQYQYDPIMTAKTSFLGAMNVLDLARREGARVLQASTSEVYGDPTVHPQTEAYRGNVSTTGPRACYDEGKRVAETLFSDYRRQYGVDSRIVRIFNTYGPHMLPNDGRVISNFIIQAIHNQDITIYGSGSQTRSFCYVDDLVNGLTAVMEKADFAGPVNLGNPHEMTILQLAHMIIQKSGSKSAITFRDLPKDDPIQRKPDIRLAMSALGWRPHIDIDEGLDRTIAYFREKY